MKMNLNRLLNHTGMFCRITILLAAALVTAGALESARAQENCHTLFHRFRNAVITVEVHTQQRVVISGKQVQKEQVTNEVLATVIDSQGLCVMALSATDPYGNMAAAMSRMQQEEVTYDNSITKIEMILPDRSRREASIVFKDNDFDILCISPVTTTDTTYRYIELKSTDTVRAGDPFLFISREPRIADRNASLFTGVISAVVDNPYHYYIPQNRQLYNRLGMPALASSGTCLGILVMRTDRFADYREVGEIPVILPAGKIADLITRIKSRSH